MGSLASRPSVPQYSAPQIVYMPAPPPLSLPDTADIGSPASGSANADSAQTIKEAREDNLLRRSRGRLSTVLTGFTGVLSDTLGGQRKNLLGE